jgi:hypothetical protein
MVNGIVAQGTRRCNLKGPSQRRCVWNNVVRLCLVNTSQEDT